MIRAIAGRVHGMTLSTPADSVDQDGFALLYRQYYKNVFNYVCFRINDHGDAEDLTGTVFLNVLRRFHTYDPDVGPAEAWLIGIAKNVVNDYLRGKSGNRHVPLDDLVRVASPDRQPDQVAAMREEYHALMEAMSQLREKDRQVIAMKFVTELKNVEIARILGMSESNVGVCIHRALKRLKKIVEREGGFLA